MNTQARPFSFGLSLISRLCALVNDSSPSSVDYVLADYLLQHYNNLDSLNIYEFSETCSVPRSSIHRFCKKLGYENFSDLKCSSHRDQKAYTYFTSLSEKQDFRTYLSLQIAAMMDDMNAILSDSLLLELAMKIHDASSVYLLSSYSSISALKDFQRPMILCQKQIHVVSSPQDSLQLKQASPKDLILVVSAMGRYAENVNPVLTAIKGEKILVTASHQNKIHAAYDQIILISSMDCHDRKTAYAKYGISYFFDMLYSFYYRQFGIPHP